MYPIPRDPLHGTSLCKFPYTYSSVNGLALVRLSDLVNIQRFYCG